MAHKVAVLGATGYVGRELIACLSRHPHVQLQAAACRNHVGTSLEEVFPGAVPCPLVALEEVPWADLDTVFLCLPHAASAAWAARALQENCRVIDLSADFRVRDAQLYSQAYGQEHPCPDLLREAVYGLTEAQRSRLASTRLIANPGCYPTSVLLGLYPLVSSGWLRRGSIIVDAKSGVSGAGRRASVANLYGEVAENVRPYQVGQQHRHRHEILQQLGDWGGDFQLVFVPQVVAGFRGMLSSIYVDWDPTWELMQLRPLYRQFYGEETFVQLLPESQVASMAHTRGSNRNVLSLHPMPESGKLLILSSLDNLLKGAAGQALQNLNAAMGWPEGEGLSSCGF